MIERGPGPARDAVALGSPSASHPLGALLEWLPALAAVPVVALGTHPTPVQRVADELAERLLAPGSGELWIKRDDLAADEIGGNKVRALELLLASVHPGDEILTVGARASTHALATAVHGARIGARTTVVRWSQAMNDDALRTMGRLAREARVIDALTPVDALAAAVLLRALRRVHWVPAGGTSPLGILGHVNAALELARQVRAGDLPEPARVVLPLGTGGTTAGLLLGFAIAGMATAVVGVRVVPRVVARAGRVLGLAARTARLIERLAGTTVPRPPRHRLRIVHDEFGGAYGRATRHGERAASTWKGFGIRLDATYSAKAGAALRVAGRGPTLFWLTFDGRWMGGSNNASTDDRQLR